MAGGFDLGHDGHAAVIGELHERQQLVQVVRGGAGIAAVPPGVFTQHGKTFAGEHPGRIIREVEMQEADLVQAAHEDDLLEMVQRVVPPRQVQHRAAIFRLRLGVDRHHRQQELGALPRDRLQHGGGTQRDGRVVRAADADAVPGDLHHVPFAREGAVAGQRDVALAAPALRDRQAHAGGLVNFIRENLRQPGQRVAVGHDARFAGQGEFPCAQVQAFGPGNNTGSAAVRRRLRRTADGQQSHDDYAGDGDGPTVHTAS